MFRTEKLDVNLGLTVRVSVCVLEFVIGRLEEMGCEEGGEEGGEVWGEVGRGEVWRGEGEGRGGAGQMRDPIYNHKCSVPELVGRALAVCQEEPQIKSSSIRL